MPLHQWYIPRGLYTAEEKAKIAAAITDYYYRHGIAKFLVEVQFLELDKADHFVGGEPTDNQVQIHVSHVARISSTIEEKTGFTERYENIIKPYTQDRGVTWEVQVADEDPYFWRMDGLIPPYAFNNKEGEELWYKSNKALPY